MVEITPLADILLRSSIQAGAIGIAVVSLSLSERAKRLLSPFIFIIGSLSSVSFFISTIFLWINIYYPDTNGVLMYLSSILFIYGVSLFLYYVFYMVIRLVHIEIRLLN
jgi:hypothetical protein